MNSSPPGFSVHGIFQVKILEWVVISYSRGYSWPRDRTRSPLLQMDSLLLNHQGSSLSPGTILSQHNLKTEVEVVLTCPLVGSWVWGNAVISAGHCPSPVLGRRWGQGEGIILHIAPFSLSSWNCFFQFERGSGNEKTLIHTHTHTHICTVPASYPSHILCLARQTDSRTKYLRSPELTTKEPFPSRAALVFPRQQEIFSY